MKIVLFSDIKQGENYFTIPGTQKHRLPFKTNLFSAWYTQRAILKEEKEKVALMTL